MAWTQLYQTPLPSGGAGSQRLNWTRATIRNVLYLFRVDNPFILRLDTETVPGSPQVIAETPTFLNMGAIQGIAEGRSRLVAWDIVNRVYWSAVDDPLDFTPDLATLANNVPVDAVKGRIVHIVGTDEGFIIYTTSNIVTARYRGGSPQLATEVFQFEELSDTLGIFTSDHVAVADNGFHHVWTQAGLFRINANRSPGSPLAEPIFSELGDYIRQYEGYPRLSHHRDRYFCIWLTYRDFLQGRNILKRNPLDGSTWFSEPYLNEFKYRLGEWNLDLMLDAREQPPTYLPPKDVALSINTDCTQEILPWRTCENVLWAGYLLRRPPIKIERKSTTVDEWLFPNTGGPAEMIRVPSATIEWYEILPTTYEDYEVIYTQAQGFKVGAEELSYSFDPLAQMLEQYNQWVKEKDENHTNAQGLFAVITYSLAGRVHTATAIAPQVETTFVPIPNSSLQVRKGERWTTKEALPPIAEGQPDRWRYTNYQRITDDTGQTTSSFWIEIEQSPLLEGTPRIGDETGWQSVGTETSFANLNVWEYLTGERLAFNDNSLLDHNYRYQPASNEANNARQVYTTARYYATTDPELFVTSRAIWGQTDGCSYASIASFAQRRAFTEGADTTQDKFARNVRIEDFIPVDNEQWYVEGRVDFDFTWKPYDVDTTDGLTNSPAGYIDLGLATVPRHRLLNIYAVAHVSGLGGSPAAELSGNLSQARSAYPTLDQISGLLQVYRDRGWTVVPPPAGNLSPPPLESPRVVDNTPQGEPLEDGMNGIPQSGVLEELTTYGTVCGRVVEPIVNRPKTFTPPALKDWTNPTDLTKLYGLDGWESQTPKVVDLTGQAGQGPIYPVYSRALVYDQQLKRWGSFDDFFYIFLDYNPVNAVSYDPVSDITVSSFTYDNFLSSLGALLTNRMLHLFDRSPDQAYAVYGKIGYRRKLWTRLTEVRCETLDTPSALMIIEPSLDGKTINPYQVRVKQLANEHDTGYIDVTAQWFNFVITGGRFEIVRFETTGHSMGER